ncbi:MAG: ABC transporter permease [Paracoccaceae bacterium]
MFKVETRRSLAGAAFVTLGLIHLNTVRMIRAGYRNAMVGLAMNIVQVLIMLAVFFLMFSVLGMRKTAIRGDFIVYLLSGIFLYMTNIRSMRAVAKAEGATSSMMQHAPMNTVISICSSALAALYTQTLSILAILFVYHVAFSRVDIDDPVGFGAMVLLAWFNGIAVGLLFLSLKPWWPGFFDIAQNMYTRVNMIASGKMFVANSLGATMLMMFDWNPLFHIIDQARGYAFINYNPHFTSISYPVTVTIVLITLGLMGEFFTRNRVSVSWQAGR